MLRLFGPKMPVSDDELEWLLACFAWAASALGGVDPLAAAPLVIADPAHFPSSGRRGHARAAELFDQVRAFAGMPEALWPVALVEGEADRAAYLGRGVLLNHHGKSAPGGTFGRDETGFRITYNPSGLAQPEALVATFAHELAHYRMRAIRSLPPGGMALEEHATDFLAIILGFGVPMANSAKEFGRWQEGQDEGWQSRLRGYLSELARVTALAMLLQLGGQDRTRAESALKPYLRKPFRSARDAIARRFPDLRATIEAIDLSDWA